MLSRARADTRRGCRLPGDSVAASFADWLRFLAAVAEPQLLVAVFDTPKSRRLQQPQQREQLAPEYLQHRKRRKLQQAGEVAAASTSNGTAGSSTGANRPSLPGGDPLRPFKQQVEQLGGVYLEAAGGWEADDGMAAVCRAVHQRHPAASVVVASGDTDMLQLLAPQVQIGTALRNGCWGCPWAAPAPCLSSAACAPQRCLCPCGLRKPEQLHPACLWQLAVQVSWLQLHNQTSLGCPLGAELVTAEAFQQQHGFPPSAYPDWLAFTGAPCRSS